jgi:hypothetical protein
MLITLDLKTNTLIVDIDPPLAESGPATAILDLATRGRIMGIDIADRYIVMDHRPATHASLVRSVGVQVVVEDQGRRLVIPRSGPTWEIAFPSGNRCWRPLPGTDGSLSCEIATNDAPPD